MTKQATNKQISEYANEIQKIADTKKEITKNDVVINENILNSLKSNAPMTILLNKVNTLSSGLMKLVPEMAILVNDMITELDSKQKGKIKGQIDMAFLKTHLYNLSLYKRKIAVNSAFEMAVTRAVKLGILMNTDNEQFSVNDKNEVLVMDKIATPMVDVIKKGQKGGSTKVANTSTDLVPVHTGLIDKVWSTKFAVATRTPSTKDVKIELTLKDSAKNFYELFNKALDYSSKKDVRFFDLVDEATTKQLSLIGTLFNSEAYKQMRNFSIDYQVAIDGTLEKSSLGKKQA